MSTLIGFDGKPIPTLLSEPVGRLPDRPKSAFILKLEARQAEIAAEAAAEEERKLAERAAQNERILGLGKSKPTARTHDNVRQLRRR